jgi:uncharacterized protein YqjF (DUF2071 family)
VIQAAAFLTAQWSNVGLITYDVDASLLRSLLPTDCELDMRDGRAFVSFVMFDFLQTRVKGIRWPGYVNFPEINLRFYVRHAGQRGVCFVRELVPRRLIAWIARTIYNEPYVATAMRSEISQSDGMIQARHRFFFANRWHQATVSGRVPAVRPPLNSVEHFFKEHEWGFGRSRGGALRRYRVVHPEWDVYPEAQATLDVDFSALYGQSWSILNHRVPYSVVLAVGSEVAVYPHTDSPA